MIIRHITTRRVSLGIVLCVGLSACAGFGTSPESTLAPLVTATTSTVLASDTTSTADSNVNSNVNSSVATTTPTSTTTVTTQAPTTTVASIVQNVVAGPFPTAVPAGKCTPQAIRADFGRAPEAWIECAGAWAVTRIENCPPDVECEGVDIFRWTSAGWVHRGMTYSLCVLMVDETGMPRSVNDQLLAGNTDCIEPIRYAQESSTGSLQVGAKGERTRRVQRRLIEWRLLNDSADGYFGANTRNAVVDFQHLAGLQPTGVFDERTMRALGLPWP